MDIIPRVAMKGGTFNRVTISPFPAPITVPISKTRRKTGKISSPLPSIIPEVKQAPRLIVEPTDRSSPRVRITRVCPVDTIPRRTAWRSMLTAFRGVLKSGEIREEMIIKAVSKE